MTNEEFGQVYEKLRPGLLATLTGAYRLTRESAEDLVQNMALQLLERPEMLVAMSRPQVEAWFKTRDAGRGRGLKWRVRDLNVSETKRHAREKKFLTIQQKDRQGSIYLMNGEKHTLPPAVDFTDLVIAKVDAEQAPPPRLKRKYTRKPAPALIGRG
jgi:hypothetical protein